MSLQFSAEQIAPLIQYHHKWQQGHNKPPCQKKQLMGLGFRSATAVRLSEIEEYTAEDAVAWAMYSIRKIMLKASFSVPDAAETLKEQADASLTKSCGRYNPLTKAEVQHDLLDIDLKLSIIEPDAFFRVLRVAWIVCGELSDQHIAIIRSLRPPF